MASRIAYSRNVPGGHLSAGGASCPSLSGKLRTLRNFAPPSGLHRAECRVGAATRISGESLLQKKHRRVVLGPCRSENTPSGGPPGRENGPKSWLSRLADFFALQQPLGVVLNLVSLFFILRMWPLAGGSSDKASSVASGTGGTESAAQTVVVKVPFSDFVQRVNGNDVEEVFVDGTTLKYVLRKHRAEKLDLPAGAEMTRVLYTTVRPADFPTPYKKMVHNNTRFSAVDKRGNRFFTVLVYTLYVGLLLTALQRLPVKLLQRGTGRRHTGSANVPQSTVTFADVAGVDEAKEELAEIVDFLRMPERFSKLGARPPSGVLLVGPPGTGKTLLAKAVAGEAHVPFFSIAASEFVELYVGMGAMRVRELFAAARKDSPAIVFIDEIDAVAKGRDSRLRSVGNDEREQTLNQLLTELDGFDTGSASDTGVVICIAATNRPDVLDAALLRPGRFDRRVAVERPDRVGREQILSVHMQRRSLPLADNVSIASISAATTGFTGADLANLVNEAALLAGRDGKSAVGHEEFDKAVLRAVAGVEKKRSILQGVEKDVVARHEVGHALVSTACQQLIAGSPAVEKLSIVPRSGGALGFTYIPPTAEDRALLFDVELRGQLAMLLGGRAAEARTCEHVSTGAGDDIRRATDLAHKYVSEYGLCTAVGPISVSGLAGGGEDGPMILSDSGQVSRVAEMEAKWLVEASLAVAQDVVDANRSLHRGLSDLLVAQEKVEGEVLGGWLEGVVVPPSLREFVLHGTMPDDIRKSA